MVYKVLFFVLAVSNAIYAQSYTAAVLEYTPVTRDTSLSDEDYVLINAQRYVNFVQQATTRNARIVVFPEYGLTTTILPSNLTNVSTPVPEASVRAVPCLNSTGYAKFFVDLSCAAREHSIHTVINLIESSRNETNGTNTTIFYNTNVVFDTSGAVIARYRKINLFNEPQITPGNETVTFTAFDVTFGLFTCFDILFRKPAQEVLSQGATDVIYTTAWTSETPFHQAFSVQDGYAKAAGINLLVAGYNNVTNGMAGAAIYLANATVAVSSFQPASVQNIIFAQVPTIVQRTPEAVCTNNIGISPRFGGSLPDITAVLNLEQENMQQYTFQTLERDAYQIQGTLCSDGSSFCCSYAIGFVTPLTSNSTIYKMVAFYGRRGFQGAAGTIGVRTCAIVACATDDNLSCGRFNSTTNVNFASITITATLPNNDNTFYQPTTLGTDHSPISGYAYCTNAEPGLLNVTMTVETPQNVFSFGIFGRVYDVDGQAEGRGGVASIHLSLYTIIAIISAYLCFY